MKVIDKHGKEIKPGHLLLNIITGNTRAVREIITDQAMPTNTFILKTISKDEETGEYIFPTKWLYDADFGAEKEFEIVGTLDTLILDHQEIAYDKNGTIIEEGLVVSYSREKSDDENYKTEYIIEKVNFMSAYIAELNAENTLTKRKTHFTWYPEIAYIFEVEGEYGEF